jgi:hypothetical protein
LRYAPLQAVTLTADALVRAVGVCLATRRTIAPRHCAVAHTTRAIAVRSARRPQPVGHEQVGDNRGCRSGRRRRAPARSELCHNKQSGQERNRAKRQHYNTGAGDHMLCGPDSQLSRASARQT